MTFTPAETAIMLSAAMMLGAAGMLACARFAFARKSVPTVHKTALRAAVAQQRSVPKLKRMLPAQIAECVVASIRSTGCNAFAILPEDIDEFVIAWCHDNGIERPTLNVVRELLLEIPGVKRKRIWLSKSSQEHAYIRDRQRIRGKMNERPVLYWISDLEDTPTACDRASVRAVSMPRPSRDKTAQTRVRTEISQCPDTRQIERRKVA